MKPRKSFLAFAIVFAVMALGLFFLGIGLIDNPETMKLRKLDDRRARDIKQIAMAVANFYDQKESLPQSVNELTVVGFSLSDPTTKIPYSYHVVRENLFELCATFVTSNIEYGREENFYVAGVYYQLDHDKGQICYEFDVSRKNAD